MNFSEQAIEILHRTHDGNDLAPRDLYLVQLVVNHDSNEAGEVAFADLYANVIKPGGYTRPWFYGIEHLTKDHEGYVYWKDRQVEHYSFHDTDAERAAAEQLARACLACEARGQEVKFANLCF